MLLSIGDQVKPGSYRLHSVFQRAVNFERAGRLVSVVDETIGPGPLNIVLSDPHVGLLAHCGRVRGSGVTPGPAQREKELAVSGGWEEGNRPSNYSRLPTHPNPMARTPVNLHALKVSPGTVLFAGQRYRFTVGQRYDSTLEVGTVDPRRFQQNLSILGQALREAAPAQSLAFLLDRRRRKHFRGGFAQAYAKQIEHGAHQVFHGRLLEGVRRLKGCGVGLTPGGDDFIAGLLIALHVLQKLGAQDFGRTIDAVFRAAHGGNLFSNTFLALAHQGLLFGRMKELLRALTAGTRNSVRKAAEALFAIGESSGADLATGLFLTLDGLRSPGERRGALKL